MKALMIVLLLLLGGCTTLNTRDCRAHAQRAIDDVFTAEMLDWHAQHGELNRGTVATLRDWATLYAQEHATDCLGSRRANSGACTVSHWTPPQQQVSARKTGELLTTWYNGAADFFPYIQLQHAACTSRVCLAVLSMLPNETSTALSEKDRLLHDFALNDQLQALFTRSGYFDDYTIATACIGLPPESTSSFYLFYRP